MNNKYKIVVNWSNAGNAFIADVPELTGCIADGSSFFEALENVQVVIDEWMETARLYGRSVPAPTRIYSYA